MHRKEALNVRSGSLLYENVRPDSGLIDLIGDSALSPVFTRFGGPRGSAELFYRPEEGVVRR